MVIFLSATMDNGFSSHAADSNIVINPPIGPYVNPQPADFSEAVSYTSSDRIVLTPYFYWYDVFSDAHITDSDGTDALTDHPPTLTGFSYLSKAWHREQLLDMTAAGIDVLLPVYWGEPSQRIPNQPVSAQPWSHSGIPPLIQAREELLSEGRSAPRIGMFYDTSTLQYNAANERIDLTTPYGREWFYESVRDFFSLVPPKHWAMIAGQPVVFLYSASFAANHDQSCIDYLRACFTRDFAGRMPFVVREISWNARTDQVYAWGGALGLKNPGVASLGPGYDHSAVPGREPLIVPREEGRFFERNWKAFLSRPSKLVMIETWNEFHEGTEIAASREYDRTYLTLNRTYADLFKSGVVLTGRYAGARLLEISLGDTNRESGLVQFDWPDGVTAATNLGGLECRAFVQTQFGGRYAYFRVDNSFKWADTMDVLVVLDYFDAKPGQLRLEYDGSDLRAPFQGAYTASPVVLTLSGSRTWRKAVFPLDRARFRNSQNGGADFRLNSTAPEFAVQRVQLVRPGLEAGNFTAANGFQLTLFGAPGYNFALETSTTLTNWTELARVQLSGTSTLYTDTAATQHLWRWYRARPR
jgi:hypothetical protein